MEKKDYLAGDTTGCLRVRQMDLTVARKSSIGIGFSISSPASLGAIANAKSGTKRSEENRKETDIIGTIFLRKCLKITNNYNDNKSLFNFSLQ